MISAPFDRRDFPTLEHHCYLNQASLGLIGRPAVQAMHEFIDDYARHGNCFMSDQEEAGHLDSLRAVAARLLSCPPAQLAIVGSASEILAQIPLMIPCLGDKTVVAVESDFPAVTRPWLRQQGLGRARIRFVEDRRSESLTDALIDAIDGDTAVVAIGSVQFATGTAVDVDRISKAISAVDGRLIVDVTQELGARRIDAGAWNADAVVCSGYKWLGGHGGVALALISPRLLGQVPPMTGWMGARDPFDFDATSLSLADDARRYTQSTMAYASVACLSAAIGQLLDAGETRIETHATRLARMLAEEAARRGWLAFRSAASPDGCGHIVALSHPERSAEDARRDLADRSIVCSARGGRVRVSIGPYNDENDIDKLTQLLR